jgi:RecA-family ATPase
MVAIGVLGTGMVGKLTAWIAVTIARGQGSPWFNWAINSA